MDRVVRDGKVGVIIHENWGSGFFEEHRNVDIITDPFLIDLIENEEKNEGMFQSYLDEKYGVKFFGDIRALGVVWIPIGKEFIITSYDGLESIQYKDELNWIKFSE